MGWPYSSPPSHLSDPDLLDRFTFHFPDPHYLDLSYRRPRKAGPLRPDPSDFHLKSANRGRSQRLTLLLSIDAFLILNGQRTPGFFTRFDLSDTIDLTLLCSLMQLANRLPHLLPSASCPPLHTSNSSERFSAPRRSRRVSRRQPALSNIFSMDLLTRRPISALLR